MQSLLRIALGLLLLPAAALADSRVSDLPSAAVPLPDGSALYVDQGPGNDTKLSTNYGAALGILSGGANTVRGNFTATSGPEAANAMPSCPPSGANHLNYVANTGFVCGTTLPTPALTIQQSMPANPPGIASVTAQMAGLAVSYTPVLTGKTRISFVGVASNATAAGGVNIFLRYGTGAAPANGAAATGTQVGTQGSFLINSATAQMSVPLEAYVVLTPNTTYWVDVTLGFVNGGTAIITSPIFVIEELP